MLIPNVVEMIILTAVSLVLCCMGFKSFVWFMSIGYGLSTAGIGLTLLIMSLVSGNANVFFIAECLLLIIYGFRLGGFLLIREMKNEKYRAKLAEAGGAAKVPVFVSVVIWIFCGVLYIFQTSPAIYRLQNGLAVEPNVAQYIGLAISVLGIVLESVADKQKSAQKNENPNLPAMKGLFKMCRCPNYFGEILFWTGLFVSGIGAVQGVQWIIAVIGYVGIVYIMFSGAKRLETRHIKNYGSNPDYNAYADKTPVLIPLIPLYHMVTPESIKKAEEKKAAKKE